VNLYLKLNVIPKLGILGLFANDDERVPFIKE